MWHLIYLPSSQCTVVDLSTTTVPLLLGSYYKYHTGLGTANKFDDYIENIIIKPNFALLFMKIQHFQEKN
jgi:hypothetical protein